MSEHASSPVWRVRRGRQVTDETGRTVASGGDLLPLDDPNACAARNRSAVVRVFEEMPADTRQMAEERNVAEGEVRRSMDEELEGEDDAASWED